MVRIMKKTLLSFIFLSIFTNAMQKPQESYSYLLKEITQLVDSYKDLDSLLVRLKIWFKTPGNQKMDDNPIFMDTLLNRVSARFKLDPETIAKLLPSPGAQLWAETKIAQKHQKNIVEQRISPQLSAQEIKNKLLALYTNAAEPEIVALVKNNPQWSSIELNHETPLMIAARRNFKNLVKMLVKQDASINKVNKNQTTALINAVVQLHLDMVKLLLSLGADPNIAGYHDRTPLMVAVDAHSIPVAYELIQAGARINKQDYQGDTALMRAIKHGAPDSMILFLLDNSTPADLTIRNKNGETALIVAIKKSIRNDLVQELLNRGASITPDTFKAAQELADDINSKEAILKTLNEKQSNPEKIFREFEIGKKL